MSGHPFEVSVPVSRELLRDETSLRGVLNGIRRDIEDAALLEGAETGHVVNAYVTDSDFEDFLHGRFTLTIEATLLFPREVAALPEAAA